jgi:hypothetical protein
MEYIWDKVRANYHFQLRGRNRVEIKQRGYAVTILTMGEIIAEGISPACSQERRNVLSMARAFLLQQKGYK